MKGFFTKKTTKLILLAICVMTLAGCGSHPNNATVTNHTGSAIKNKTEEVEEEPVAAEEPVNTDFYIVEELNMSDETIALYSVAEAKQYRYKYTMATRFLDKFGKNSVWASFTTGTVVTIGDLLPSSGALSSIQKSGDVWIYEDLSKYKLDTDRNLINIDGSNYKITSNTKAYSDAEKILLSDIGQKDVITVVGYGKEILSIAVTTGHGYIHLTNTSLFDDSMIFIGNKIAFTVYGDQTIEIPEGTYKVTVANNGWGGSDDYTVCRNETTEIDLDALKGDGPSYCLLTFLVTVPDTYVYIDGEIVDVTEPQYVQYGPHKLVVKCDGYTSWNKTLVVNSESATITLEMEAEEGQSAANSENENTNNSEENTENNTTENASENSSDNSSNNGENSGDNGSKKDDKDYEVDYLSTISDLISNLSN